MSISGVSYQQANQVYQNTQQAKTENRKETGKTIFQSPNGKRTNSRQPTIGVCLKIPTISPRRNTP